MRPHRSLLQVLGMSIAVTAMILGLTTATAAKSEATPIPQGGSSAVLVITNNTGMPLTLKQFPDTSVGAGSSMDFRWIDAPPASLGMGRTTVVRAWTSNPLAMGVTVTYTYRYRSAVVNYTASLSHILGFTDISGSKASPGESVRATLIRPAPRMLATYVLS